MGETRIEEEELKKKRRWMMDDDDTLFFCKEGWERGGVKEG